MSRRKKFRKINRIIDPFSIRLSTVILESGLERKKEARVSKLIENPGRHYAWHGCIKFLDAPAKIGGSMQCIRYKRRAVACLTCLLVLTRGHDKIESNTSSCWINHRYSIEPFLIHLFDLYPSVDISNLYSYLFFLDPYESKCIQMQNLSQYLKPDFSSRPRIDLLL